MRRAGALLAPLLAAAAVAAAACAEGAAAGVLTVSAVDEIFIALSDLGYFVDPEPPLPFETQEDLEAIALDAFLGLRIGPPPEPPEIVSLRLDRVVVDVTPEGTIETSLYELYVQVSEPAGALQLVAGTAALAAAAQRRASPYAASSSRNWSS